MDGARIAIVAGEVATVAASQRRVGGVVEVEVAVVAAGGTTPNHVVAEDPATIDVVAALVALGAVAA
jgi:hypothetical protein